MKTFRAAALFVFMLSSVISVSLTAEYTCRSKRVFGFPKSATVGGMRLVGDSAGITLVTVGNMRLSITRPCQQGPGSPKGSPAACADVPVVVPVRLTAPGHGRNPAPAPHHAPRQGRGRHCGR